MSFQYKLLSHNNFRKYIKDPFMKNKLLYIFLIGLLSFTSFCKKDKDDDAMKLGLLAFAMQQPGSTNFTFHVEVKDPYSKVIPNATVQVNSTSISSAKVLENTKEQRQTTDTQGYTRGATDANGIALLTLPAGAHSLVILDASGNVRGTFAVAIREAGMVMLSNEKSVKVTLAYTVGGTVKGLSGTLVLQNNSKDDLTLTTDGAYTFPTALVTGSTYSITIKTQPTTHSCSVSNASGTLTAYKTDVNITCISTNYINGSSVTLTVGYPLPITPTNHVEGSTYTVSPTLPAGMSIDPNTGVISGTPTAVTATTEYTVTQNKPDGNTTVYTFSITVKQPETTYKNGGNLALTVGSASSISMTGVHVPGSTYAVSPTLPTCRHEYRCKYRCYQRNTYQCHGNYNLYSHTN
jgi:hypothetical protein